MKRKILAVLLVLIMLTTIMPLAAYAEDGNTCTDGHTFGTEGHAKHVCQICLHFTDCVDANSDCICDICSYEFHDGAYESTESGHRYICSNCTSIVFSENHYDNNSDGICDYCSYNIGCKHSTPIWIYNQYNHYLFCAYCSEFLTAEEEHTMQNGTCTVCSFTPCTGNHTFGTDGALKHFCEVCGHVEPCSDGDKDCVCDVCNLESHTWLRETDENHHWWYCENCDLIYGNKYEHLDTDNNDICDDCDYALGSGDSGTDGSGTGGSASDGSGTGGSSTGSGTDTPSTGGSGTNGSGTGNSNLDKVPKTGDISVAFLGIALLLFATAAALSVNRKRV